MAATRVPLFLLLALAMVELIIEMVNRCVDYVFIPGPKVNPSKACCVEVCKLDVPCFCDHLPQETEEVMSFGESNLCCQILWQISSSWNQMWK